MSISRLSSAINILDFSPRPDAGSRAKFNNAAECRSFDLSSVAYLDVETFSESLTENRDEVHNTVFGRIGRTLRDLSDSDAGAAERAFASLKDYVSGPRWKLDEVKEKTGKTLKTLAAALEMQPPGLSSRKLADNALTSASVKSNRDTETESKIITTSSECYKLAKQAADIKETAIIKLRQSLRKTGEPVAGSLWGRLRDTIHYLPRGEATTERLLGSYRYLRRHAKLAASSKWIRRESTGCLEALASALKEYPESTRACRKICSRGLSEETLDMADEGEQTAIKSRNFARSLLNFKLAEIAYSVDEAELAEFEDGLEKVGRPGYGIQPDPLAYANHVFNKIQELQNRSQGTSASGPGTIKASETVLPVSIETPSDDDDETNEEGYVNVTLPELPYYKP